MRQRLVEFPNMAPVLTDFYMRTLYSTWTLATGATGFAPFSEAEAATLRNYSGNKNFFRSQRGSILALQANFYGASYASIKTLKSSAWGDIIDAMHQIIAQGTLVISLDSVPAHELQLSDIVNLPTMFSDAQQLSAAGEQNMIPMSQNATLKNRAANVEGDWLSPPLFVEYARTVSFQVSLASGVSVAAVINTFILQFKCVIEEYPNANTGPVRV